MDAITQTDPDTVTLARSLIRLPSVTPRDEGCQTLIGERLAALGFQVTPLPFAEVANLWARHGGEPPLLVLAGHTDVVPAGPEELWSSPPFAAELRDGWLVGRGAADMKGSLAAMLTATQRFLARRPRPRGSLAFLLTSDEEGPAVHGTRRVVEWLRARGVAIDWCVVGEPTALERVGDTVKNGRRGSLSGRLRVAGRQGHVAYPHLAVNPIHRCSGLIADLVGRHWDDGNEDFPPTTFQISNIHGGTGAGNVIPGHIDIDFNFRFSPASTADGLKQAVEDLCHRHGLEYTIDWTLFGQPFHTGRGRLTAAVEHAVQAVAGIEPRFSTTGGTSDGRFIAPTGAEVVELGPVNATIHKIDERIAVVDLELLSRIYEALLDELLG